MQTQTDETNFLLKLFQLEKFIKKYKYHLIIAVAVLIVGVVGIEVNSYLNTQKLIKTNTAYNKLLSNPNDKEALATLKENQKLYKLYLLTTSNNNITKLKQVANGKGVVANIAKYQLAMIKGDKKEMENYALSIGSIYKDLALLNLERLYLKENNHKKAQEIAQQIEDEDIAKLAKNFLHYGIVK